MRLSRRAAAGLVFLALLAPACSVRKSYSFPSVRIDATVNRDGSLDLVEQRTFDFHGHFHFAYFQVEHKQFDDVTNFQVREGNRVYSEGPETPGHVKFDDNVLDGPGGFKYQATWYFDAKDQRRTFTLSYHVLCAVDVYADAAHLLWKFIGEGWTVPTRSAVITVHLPQLTTNPPARPDGSCFPGIPPGTFDIFPQKPQAPVFRPLQRAEVRAWGHGPLQGSVRIPDPQTVVLSVRDLPPGRFVEGSILMPADAVPLEAASPEAKRGSILADEASLAEQANAARLAARAADRRHTLLRWLILVLAAGLLLVAVLLMVTGRLRDRVRDVPRTLTDPPEPNLHPSKLAMRWALASRKSGLTEAFRAELLNLAATQAVDVEPIGTVTTARDFRLSLRKVPDDELDEKFADFLFADGKPVDLNEMKPNTEQRADLREWRRQLETDASAQFPNGSGRPETAALGWAVVLSLAAGLALGILGAAVGWGLAVAGEALVLWIVSRRVLHPRPKADAAESLARWAAFRHYLRQFSSMTEGPAASVVIWQRYLAFAVALGVAKEVEKQVQANVGLEDLPSPWPGAPSGLDGFTSYRSFQAVENVSSLSAIAASSSDSSGSSSSSSFSSSSGFGGGFSSGGGGGGGGTGGGAG